MIQLNMVAQDQQGFHYLLTCTITPSSEEGVSLWQFPFATHSSRNATVHGSCSEHLVRLQISGG